MAVAGPWWRSAVIYQILVPSFFDSNGDGMGDLQGIASKLEYIEWLGIDAIWLSPIYASPLAELGYDVSSYVEVNPRFGSLNDFDELLASAHARGIRLILDWVPNHTSSEHPWFQESRSSRENPKRDWYVWRDPAANGSPPNNWLSVFGGSAWSQDPETQQYFYHVFLKEQPDLNWRNPDVQAAMHDAMRFWLDRGVDGFRIDALDLLVEDDDLQDNPPNPDYNPERDGPDMVVVQEHTRNNPVNHVILADMRRVVDEYPDRVLLGELYLDPTGIASYYGSQEPELHLPLNPIFANAEWSADELADQVNAFYEAVPDGRWPTWMVSTHDGRRVASRAGIQQAGPAAMMLLTLRGTPIVYYGDEIGMHDVEVPPERERDPQGKRIGRRRDPARTPMQWNGGPHAGFTAAEPWLPLPEDAHLTNVNEQSGGPSLLEFYRKLLRMRRGEPALQEGELTDCRAEGDVLTYRRHSQADRFVIAMNLSGESASLGLDGPGKLELSTYLDREEDASGSVELRPNEAILVRES